MKLKTNFLLFMILVFLSGPIACGYKSPPTPPKDTSSK
jgi:predicted small lipoprotein YifL